jgi:hypothetical protein
MNVAELVAKSPTVVDLNINFRGLYLLAAPTTPVEVVAEVAALDGKVTTKDVTRATSSRKRASTSPAPAKSKSKADSPNIDPHDVVAAAILAKCSDDNKWRSMSKIAMTAHYAESACREAMKRLEKEGYVVTRKAEGGIEIEYQIGERGEIKLRHALAAQAEEIIGLKARIAELEKQLELATAPVREMAVN